MAEPGREGAAVLVVTLSPQARGCWRARLRAVVDLARPVEVSTAVATVADLRARVEEFVTAFELSAALPDPPWSP
jgi:hypothetical protein